VKLVMTLLARDEADIIRTHLEYHLSAGVDFVIATDHRSEDGTTDVLEEYERAGVLQLLREESQFIRQDEWQTRMARLATTEHAADWVITSDADEFWWPRGGTLKEVLEAVPDRFGAVRALVRNFVPRRDDEEWFGDGLTVRLAASAPINDPASPFRPVVKVAHRADPKARITSGGAHGVLGLSRPLLRSWHPLEDLHLPLRSRAQCARKYAKTWTGWQWNLRGDLTRARTTFEQGRADVMWDRVSLDEATLASGLAEGFLVHDTRLRDAFRALGVGPLGEENVRPSSERALAAPTRSELIGHALETAVFEEAERVRFGRRIDEIEARVARLRS
jgi:Glycosyl transferase family 2